MFTECSAYTFDDLDELQLVAWWRIRDILHSDRTRTCKCYYYNSFLADHLCVATISTWKCKLKTDSEVFVLDRDHQEVQGFDISLDSYLKDRDWSDLLIN